MIFLQISAVTPSFLLIWYFKSRDVYPEPLSVIWGTFCWGIAAVIPVVGIGLFIQELLVGLRLSSPFMDSFGKAFFVAALTEETFKFLVLYLYCARKKEFDEPMDGIVYGVSASLGFATLENILYVSDGGFSTALLRALTAVPGHAMLGAIMGYYFGQAFFNPAMRKKFMFRALAVPILLHGLYDFPLMVMESVNQAKIPAGDGFYLFFTIMALAVLIYEWTLALKMTRKLRRLQLDGQEPGNKNASAGATGSVKGSGLAWPLVILGGLSVAVGGAATLGLGLIIISGEMDSADFTNTFVGWFIVGAVPLILGVILFRIGVRNLNRPK